MNGWIKKEPATPKSTRFTCPHCRKYCIDICYDNEQHSFCSYRFCPHCGKEVRTEKKKPSNKHRPLCLARVFAYEVGMDLSCEECPIKYCDERNEAYD